MSTAAIVLAAGFSRRLGRPKQEIVLGGQSLLQRAAATARSAGLWPVIVVVREDASPLGLSSEVVCVPNSEAAEGMATSVRAGVQALQASFHVPGAVLMTCDQPLLTAAHLRELCRDSARITGSAYRARVGVPAYFPAEVFPYLLTLAGDAGARDLLQKAVSVHNEDLALDIDTEEDLKEAERRFTQRRD